jgi:hypothetical protein
MNIARQIPKLFRKMYWVRVLFALCWSSVLFKFWLIVWASEELRGKKLPTTVTRDVITKTAIIE